MDAFVAVLLAIIVLGVVIWYLYRSRKRAAERLEQSGETAAAAGLATASKVFDATEHHAPVEEFHVKGDEAMVTFGVPMPDKDDEVLNDLLLAEAVEVVRQRRHTLPIDDVEHIVVYAGRDGEHHLVGRTKLPSKGELPPPQVMAGLSLSHVAHDPFAAPFEERSDHSVVYDTRADVPADELPRLVDDVKIPKGLERGLRATGVDPEQMEGPDFVLALLRMFGYSVTEQAQPHSYIGVKDGQSVFILTDAYGPGEYPELDEGVVRRFLADFNSSGADRGMLVSDKYGPFMINEIESHQPKVRFITRERIQSFIDSMALG